jgi:UDP-2-acetamido-2,6-beta-L-arabino-hexul-4-ose reductase
MYNRILITGAKGFIGKNLVAELRNMKKYEILEFDKESTLEELSEFTANCDFIFHMAGINRPEKVEEFYEGNAGFTMVLLDALKSNGNKAPVVLTSSTQAAIENEYGKSKREAEIILEQYSQETGAPSMAFRLPNVFGKWCRPSYNSVVATFCHNIAHDLPITINDAETKLNLVYIDDVISTFNAILDTEHFGFKLITDIDPVYQIKLSELSALLTAFRHSRVNRSVPDQSEPLIKKLYATYMSYLPEDNFGYPLKMNVDKRGSFTEFLKTNGYGQVSINISKPSIIKGNHWHHTKNEKFLVVSGSGIIRFRKIGSDNVINYHVSGDKLEVIDIPTGYTHNIENLGITDMVTVMWANEPFDPDKPDTYCEEV